MADEAGLVPGPDGYTIENLNSYLRHFDFFPEPFDNYDFPIGKYKGGQITMGSCWNTQDI
jgi:hypothetical protein